MIKKTFLKVGMAALMAASFTSNAFADGIEYEKRFEKNCQMKTVEFCRQGAQTLSKKNNWLPFVAYGGNETLFNSAKNVVRRLNKEGIRAYLVHAKDRDTIDITMHVDIYSKGGTQFGLTAYDNDKNPVAKTEEGLYQQAMKAYRADYGQVASVQTQVPVSDTQTSTNTLAQAESVSNNKKAGLMLTAR